MRLAQGIGCFSECSGQDFRIKSIRKPGKETCLRDLWDSEGEDALLKRAFRIDNIGELAENKYVLIVQTTVAMASMLLILRAAGVL